MGPRDDLSVVVLSGGEPRPELVAALGEPRARALRQLLITRARAWATAAFGAAAVRVMDREPDAGGWAAAFAPVRENCPDEAAFPTAGAGDTLALAPELPVWPPELAVAALEDLRAGCTVCLGPVFDGGAYLVGVSGAAANVREAITEVDLASREAMTGLIVQAEARGWEVGLLRTERALRRAADVRALLADPLCDRELREFLEA